MTAGRLLLVIAGSSPLYGVADRFVSHWAELEPTEGLILGLAGTPGRLSDWSPEGRARVAEGLRQGLAELDRTPLLDGADRRAASVMRDRLQVWLASAAAHDWALQLDAGFLGPPAMDRMALSTARLDDAGDAELLASRRGASGGYQLTRRPEEVTVGDVLRAVEGARTTLGMRNGRGQRAPDLAELWEEIDRALSQVVDRLTFGELAERARARAGTQAMYHI